MQPHSSFDALARLIQRLDADGRSVRRAEATTATDEDGSLRATIDVSVPVATESDGESALEPATATVDDGLCVTLQAPAFPDPAAALGADYPSASTTVTDLRVDDGCVIATLAVAIEPGGGESARGDDESAQNDAESARSDDAPTVDSESRTDSAVTERATPSVENHDRTGRGSERNDRVAERNESAHATAAFGAGPQDVAVDASAGDKPIGDEPTAEEATADEPNGGGSDTEQADGDASSDPETKSEESASAEPNEEESPSLSTVRDESVPPYEDTAYLAALYERCGTFEEMSERIEMDVSAETVRRYMIDADVHSPASYSTSDRDDPASDPAGETPEETDPQTDGAPDVGSEDDATAGETAAAEAADSLPDEQLVADGIGLPEELALRDVVDAVVGARTVHEVQREIGLEYDRTRHLLTQLNVLDLVVGRVSDGTDQCVSVEAVTARIRQCTPDAA